MNFLRWKHYNTSYNINEYIVINNNIKTNPFTFDITIKIVIYHFS